MQDKTLLHVTSEEHPVASASDPPVAPVVEAPPKVSPVTPDLEPGTLAEQRSKAATTSAGDGVAREKGEPAEESVDYSQHKVGDLIDGVEIHHILLQYTDAIVFTSARGGIYFRQNLGARGDAVLVEFYRLTSKSNARLKQAYGRQVNGLLGAALAEALNLPDGADLREPFKVVDEFIDSVGPIKHIFGATDSWVLFVDTDGEIICDYPTVTDQAAPLITEFYRLRQLGKSSLRATEIGDLTHILGTELGIALQRMPPIEPNDAFSASRDYIQLRNESRMRVRYISASLAAAVVFGLSAWAIVRSDLGLLLGCIGGIIGASISVLQRSSDLEIRRFLPAMQVIMQGAVRVTLGILFGLLIVAASRANLALGTLATSENGLFIAGVVAGFSERFVPDLLTKIASDGGSADRE